MESQTDWCPTKDFRVHHAHMNFYFIPIHASIWGQRILFNHAIKWISLDDYSQLLSMPNIWDKFMPLFDYMQNGYLRALAVKAVSNERVWKQWLFRWIFKKSQRASKLIVGESWILLLYIWSGSDKPTRWTKWPPQSLDSNSYYNLKGTKKEITLKSRIKQKWSDSVERFIHHQKGNFGTSSLQMKIISAESLMHRLRNLLPNLSFQVIIFPKNSWRKKRYFISWSIG